MNDAATAIFLGCGGESKSSMDAKWGEERMLGSCAILVNAVSLEPAAALRPF
jgi:hypothetical protein